MFLRSFFLTLGLRIIINTFDGDFSLYRCIAFSFPVSTQRTIFGAKFGHSTVGNRKLSPKVLKDIYLVQRNGLLLSASSSGVNSIDMNDKNQIDSINNSEIKPTIVYQHDPIFDFSLSENDENNLKLKSIQSFERIDDAIMGGISTSALRDVPNKPYASWSGVIRTDGGGFCGMRTLPFVKEDLSLSTEASLSSATSAAADTSSTNNDINMKTYGSLNAQNQTGIFIRCKLNSDDEPERRVWKVTLRTDSSRGEVVYQSMFQIPVKAADHSVNSHQLLSDEDGFQYIHVPFESFQLVRGPKAVPNGPKLDTSRGIYQIGMTASKFKIGYNNTTTELENFRAGYFELCIKTIGFYKSLEVEDQLQKDDTTTNESNDYDEDSSFSSVGLTSKNTNSPLTVDVPKTLTKEEAQKKRPIILKLLLPVSKLFFSEPANRRKSAMKQIVSLLQKSQNRRNNGGEQQTQIKDKASSIPFSMRLKAIYFGIQLRKKSIGVIPSIYKTMCIVGIDSLRTVLGVGIKVALVYPIQFVLRMIRFVKKKLPFPTPSSS